MSAQIIPFPAPKSESDLCRQLRLAIRIERGWKIKPPAAKFSRYSPEYLERRSVRSERRRVLKMERGA